MDMGMADLCPLREFKPCRTMCAWHDPETHNCAVMLLASCVHDETVETRDADAGAAEMDGGDAR